jgi:hypothetical protein
LAGDPQLKKIRTMSAFLMIGIFLSQAGLVSAATVEECNDQKDFDKDHLSDCAEL